MLCDKLTIYNIIEIFNFNQNDCRDNEYCYTNTNVNIRIIIYKSIIDYHMRYSIFIIVKNASLPNIHISIVERNIDDLKDLCAVFKKHMIKFDRKLKLLDLE